MLGHMGENKWTASRIPDQTGRTFIVTGANSGLGLATSRQLARRGAHVIMAVRNEAKGRQAIADLADAQPDASLELRRLDLADLDSVRAFADRIHADGVPVDVLVNNAGVMMPPRALSPQGHEIQFAANHLGHFALTGLLLDILQTGNDPRVVTVSSGLHRRGHIHFDDLTGARKYSPIAFYAQSKFANVLFGLELDRRLRAAGRPVRSLLAHPGYAATNLQTSGPTGLLNLLVKARQPALRPRRRDGGAAAVVRGHRSGRRKRAVHRPRRAVREQGLSDDSPASAPPPKTRRPPGDCGRSPRS